MQIVLRAKVKCMRRNRIVKGEKGYAEKKGTKAYEENKRLREKIKGAESAKGEYKMHEVENKNVKGGNQGLRGKSKAQELRREMKG